MAHHVRKPSPAMPPGATLVGTYRAVDPTPATAPGGGAELEALLTAYGDAAYLYGAHDIEGNGTSSAVWQERGGKLRAALLAAHAAAVHGAEAAGYARAMEAIAGAAGAVVTADPFKTATLDLRYDGWGFYPTHCAQAWPDSPTPADAIIAAAAALALATAPTPPALVNGGPPRDSLDDGR